MIEVSANLFVGNEADCHHTNEDGWAVVHACKHPCHQNSVGYRGNLSSPHPNYLIKEVDNHLFLNMVDMVQPLSPKFTNPMMNAAIGFINRNIERKKVLIHCNKGQSRSPSIAMVYLAKNHLIPNDYDQAIEQFIKKYPAYSPGNGISMYLKKNWSYLMDEL
ncbi:MAG: dual specificity protein phosphatase family protein [Candidatus Altiarchaeota archaeon]|nr:dual specificity protein phosphatase family protein [Candidatus Altiarchaeota archaeon]